MMIVTIDQCKGAKDAIRWFDSTTLYTLCLTVRLVHKVRLTIDG
jgi:hypothetical protein